MHKCYLDETLHTIIDRLTDAGVRQSLLMAGYFFNFLQLVCTNVHLGCQVHRLVIVDKDNRCIGVLSLSDILKFLVLRPLGKLVVISLSCLVGCFFCSSRGVRFRRV